MKLPNQLKQTANLSDSYEDEIKATFNRKEFTKGQFLFSQGEVCRQMFYIEKGLARKSQPGFRKKILLSPL